MRIGKIIVQLGCLAAIGLAPLPAAAQSLEARLAAYRERVERLEDQADIETLTTTFGFYFDKGLWSEAASLFAAKGSFEYEQRGVYIGPERIERALYLFGPEGLAKGYLNNHFMLQNVIVVADDGKTATGRWQGPVQLAEPNANGMIGVGIYENEYVKEGGKWKIASLHFYLTAKTDYDKPFTTGAIPMAGQSALYPPDKPPSEVYRAFPAAHIPPFSYDHPVTGEPLVDLPVGGDDVTGRAPVEFKK